LNLMRLVPPKGEAGGQRPSGSSTGPDGLSVFEPPRAAERFFTR
jgi:hypothetical protein